MIPLYKQAVDFARRCGRMTRDNQATELWRQVYSQLTAERPGMIDAMTARAEAHVLRLSMIYALLDAKNVIEVPHLQAALEVWRYAENSVKFIFGPKLGSSTADEILTALVEAAATGLTRTEIYVDLFNKHKSSDEIDAALSLLVRMALARRCEERTAGRSIERWFHVKAAHEQEGVKQ